jgi:hypothetical protein
VSVPPGSSQLWARLVRVPRRSAFVAALVLVLAGLFVPGPVGGVLLLVLALGLAALARATWPVTPPAQRIPRLVVLLLLVAGGLLKIFWGAW